MAAFRSRCLVSFTGRGFCAAVRRQMSNSSGRRPSVAVILSGCGVYDGSEVHEASAVLVHLSRQSADYQIYAPDKPQMHTINHTSGQEMEGSSRNVLVESARIARGKIQALSQLDASKHDAIVFPGGFGAAKNLCDFAVKQADCKVDEDVAKTIKDFHSAKKPIGLCCIAPVLAAKVIPGCEITMGREEDDGGRWPYAGACGAVGAMGSKHIPKDVNQVHIDAENKIVTTPAYMCETSLHEIHDGIGEMIKGVLQLV